MSSHEHATLFGLTAQFDKPQALVEAVRAARAAGYRRIEANSPFPIDEIAEEIGVRTWVIPVVGTVAALGGASIQYFAQYWMNAVDYPLNIGGRPLNSWPAFLMSAIIVLVLWGAVAAFVAFLMLGRLPRLSHPLFATQSFDRVTEDRFFLTIETADPLFSPEATARFLASVGPIAVIETRA